MLRVLNIFWSLCVYMAHLVKSLFSVSLSTSEQTIFEEEFKYLIVTSSLFNGQPQFDSKRNESFMRTTPITDKLLYSTGLVMVISFSIIVHMNLVTPLLLSFIYLSICYFLYRHDRHTQIRLIHASALDSMHQIILLSQESDITLQHQSLLSPEQLQRLGQHLSRHFETYIDIVHRLQPLIDAHNLSRLREMYNVKDEIPLTLLEFDSSEFKVEDIELIKSFIIWKRREYLLHLLALDVMSNNKSAHYGRNWRQAIRINHDLVKEYKEFNQYLASTIQADSSVPEEDTTSSAIDQQQQATITTTSSHMETDKSTLTIVYKLDTVEKLVEDIQANLFLCKQEATRTTLSSGRASSFNLEKLSKRFQHIDMNIKALSKQWETVNHLLDEKVKNKETTNEIPSPPTSPKEADMIQRSQSFRYGSLQQHTNYTQSRLRRIQSLKLDKSNKHIH